MASCHVSRICEKQLWDENRNQECSSNDQFGKKHVNVSNHKEEVEFYMSMPKYKDSKSSKDDWYVDWSRQFTNSIYK